MGVAYCGRGFLWPLAADLKLVGGIEGDLADFGEAITIAHGVTQRQLRELEQCCLRCIPDHYALEMGFSVRGVSGCISFPGRLPPTHPPNAPPDLTLGIGTESWPDLKAARLHRVSTRHRARHVSEDWSKV